MVILLTSDRKVMGNRVNSLGIPFGKPCDRPSGQDHQGEDDDARRDIGERERLQPPGRAEQAAEGRRELHVAGPAAGDRVDDEHHPEAGRGAEQAIPQPDPAHCVKTGSQPDNTPSGCNNTRAVAVFGLDEVTVANLG